MEGLSGNARVGFSIGETDSSAGGILLPVANETE
jgi:hypothetical protein